MSVTVQVVGRASRLPRRASRPRWRIGAQGALAAGETPAPLPEQLPLSRQVWVLGILAAGLLTFAGCGKSSSAEAPTGEVLVIDATQFRPAFAAAAPETKAVVDEVMAKIQDTAYPEALAGLDQLAHTPNLTDLQKKVVASLTEQVKKKQAANSAAPNQ